MQEFPVRSNLSKGENRLLQKQSDLAKIHDFVIILAMTLVWDGFYYKIESLLKKNK